MPHYHLPHNHGQDIEKVLDKMPAEENFREIAFLFQQLSDPSRLYGCCAIVRNASAIWPLPLI